MSPSEDFFETPDYDYLRKLFNDLCERKGYNPDDGDFDWTGRNMSTPVGSSAVPANAGGANEVISPSNRDRHRTGKDVSAMGKNNAAWSGTVSIVRSELFFLVDFCDFC